MLQSVNISAIEILVWRGVGFSENMGFFIDGFFFRSKGEGNISRFFFKAGLNVKVGSRVCLDKKNDGVDRFWLALPIFQIFGGSVMWFFEMGSIRLIFYARDQCMSEGKSGKTQIRPFFIFVGRSRRDRKHFFFHFFDFSNRDTLIVWSFGRENNWWKQFWGEGNVFLSFRGEVPQNGFFLPFSFWVRLTLKVHRTFFVRLPISHQLDCLFGFSKLPRILYGVFSAFRIFGASPFGALVLDNGRRYSFTTKWKM
jgi:hypothetical protein